MLSVINTIVAFFAIATIPAFCSLNAIRLESKSSWFDDMFRYHMLKKSIKKAKQANSFILKILSKIEIAIIGIIYFMFYFGAICLIIKLLLLNF